MLDRLDHDLFDLLRILHATRADNTPTVNSTFAGSLEKFIYGIASLWQITLPHNGIKWPDKCTGFVAPLGLH